MTTTRKRPLTEAEAAWAFNAGQTAGLLYAVRSGKGIEPAKDQDSRPPPDRPRIALVIDPFAIRFLRHMFPEGRPAEVNEANARAHGFNIRAAFQTDAAGIQHFQLLVPDPGFPRNWIGFQGLLCDICDKARVYGNATRYVPPIEECECPGWRNR